MKIEKKHWTIIAIVAVIIIALWYFFLRKKSTTTSKYAGMYGSFGNESGYAGMYGSFGNESNYDLDASLPMIGRESNYHDTTGGESTIGKSRPKGVLK